MKWFKRKKKFSIDKIVAEHIMYLLDPTSTSYDYFGNRKRHYKNQAYDLKKALIGLLGETIREAIQNEVKTLEMNYQNFMKTVESEEFLDKFVERIMKKQLKG